MSRKSDLEGRGSFCAGMMIFASADFFVDLDTGIVFNIAAAFLAVLALIMMCVGAMSAAGLGPKFKRSSVYLMCALPVLIAAVVFLIMNSRAGGVMWMASAFLLCDAAAVVLEMLSVYTMLCAAGEASESADGKDLFVTTGTIFLIVSIFAYIAKLAMAFISYNSGSMYLIMIIIVAVLLLGTNLMVTMRMSSIKTIRKVERQA